MKRPEASEFAEYYGKYIAKAPGTDVSGILESERQQMARLFAGRSERDGNFRYAPDKWTVKEVLGHVIDAERIFTYRALRIARGDETPLPSFEQDDYVREAGFDNHALKDLLKEFELLRGANILAIHNMNEEATKRIGTASGNPISARALIHMLVGHVDHHMFSLQEKYLPGLK